jgi:predicted DCC family thiol-disulfide oxidoreductase YuxK
VNTEITDNNGGWVLYDGDCSLCTGSIQRFGSVLRRAGFTPATLQSTRPTGPLTEMIVLLPDGRTFGGADALVQIARCVWWTWPLYALTKFPGVVPLMRVAYRRLAADRYCLGGACRLTGRKLLGAWIPLLLLPAITLMFGSKLPAWVFMWLLAFSLFVACKWLTFALAIRSGARPSSFRSASYLLAWVGMDAESFLDLKAIPPRPARTEWQFAFAKTLFGAALIWICAPLGAPVHPLLCGWCGMVGIIFLLHFGVFHLLSLTWRWFGVSAPPIMRAPLFTRSVAEFWGKRWNTAFHELVHRFTFRPASRVVGAVPATLLVFLGSGLIHDLLISLPARGGFGLPTAYFLGQGLGVLVEHSRFGRRIGLGRGLCGWLFMVVVTAVPAFWLFHPPFIEKVILPMLHAIGAI